MGGGTQLHLVPLTGRPFYVHPDDRAESTRGGGGARRTSATILGGECGAIGSRRRGTMTAAMAMPYRSLYTSREAHQRASCLRRGWMALGVGLAALRSSTAPFLCTGTTAQARDRVARMERREAPGRGWRERVRDLGGNGRTPAAPRPGRVFGVAREALRRASSGPRPKGRCATFA